MLSVDVRHGGRGREGDHGRFLEHVFLVLARYDALAGGTDRGGGFQGVRQPEGRGGEARALRQRGALRWRMLVAYPSLLVHASSLS